MNAKDSVAYLLLEIQAELEHLERLGEDVVQVQTCFRDQEHLSIHDLRGIAMLLSEIYLGVENLMLRIAKTFREPVPTGSAWHKELLDQYAREAVDIRPALFAQDTIQCLDGFRRFRHVTHHIYAFDYDWEQMKVMLFDSTKLLGMVADDIKRFEIFLYQVNSTE